MKYFLYCRKSTESEERQVLSLQSQREALDRAFGNADIDIVEALEESKSAKTPGRPVFADMLARVEAGEADGIMSWAPDRLARNSIDGGRIIYLLDTGVLRNLKFATYTFENNSQGKFMLSIMFGQSKYYSDALSENVKRGNRTKLERGWRPNRAPLGYLNDPVTRTILPDPRLFPLLRRMFEMVLYEGRTPRQVVRIARDDWGFLTPRSKRSGGKPIANSTIYKLLANPFYRGIIEWNGAEYPGSHAPIVSAEEFDRVQATIFSRSTPHATQLSFPFKGLITCGACGRMVTAERKRNRHGSRYIYYHCSARSRVGEACSEPSIEARALEAQVIDFLSTLRIPEQIADWVRAELARVDRADADAAKVAARSRVAAIAEIDTQLAELTSLRIRRLLSDEEFVKNRDQLSARRSSLQEAKNATDLRMLVEPFELLVKASNKAVEWFTAADDAGKRDLLRITCSNPCLKAGILDIQAAKPFFTRSDLSQSLHQRGVVDQVRTSASLHPQRRTGRSSTWFTQEAGRKMLARLRQVTAYTEAPFNDLPELVARLGVRSVVVTPKRPRRRRSDAGQVRGRQQRPTRPPGLHGEVKRL